MNWWGWGWSPGRQETAEFDILAAFFSAAYGITKRFTEIEHPSYCHNTTCGWRITLLDGTEKVIPI